MAQAQQTQDGGESDEDCEVYFLKPVNEYNIVDKIKEANKELFAFDTNTTDADFDATNRKVTFALNLENYAPETVNLMTTTMTTTTTSTLEEITEIGNVEITAKNAPNCELTVIEEEESAQEQAVTQIQEPEQITKEITTITTTTTSEDEAELEEICEEIIVMDVKEKTNSENHSIRRIQTQSTFDCTDEEQLNELEAAEESDSKSMTNLLTSDYEDESEDQHALKSDTDSEWNDETNKNKSIDDNSNNNEDNNVENDDDDDDDDQLSIIVASYLPNVYETNFSSFDANDNSQQNRNRSPGKVTKTRRFFPTLGGRFSLRRRHTSSNNIANNYNGNGTRSKTSSAATTLPELTDLKLNYKICCEYRHATQVTLPKYTGYLSEYGLSKEQLMQREQQMKRKQRSVLDQALKVNEEDMRKMHANERAFTTWLRNKMRFPINRTRNMYDAHSNNSNNNNNKNKNTNSRKNNGILGNKNLK